MLLDPRANRLGMRNSTFTRLNIFGGNLALKLRPVDLHTSFFILQVWLAFNMIIKSVLVIVIPDGQCFKPLFNAIDAFMVYTFEAPLR